MSDRPPYLVIMPKFGLFSSHWTDDDAFRMHRKLCDRGEVDAYVVEVPHWEGVSVKWRHEPPQVPRPDEEPKAMSASSESPRQPDTNKDAIKAAGEDG